MKFNFKEKYETAIDWAAGAINQAIKIGISVSVSTYDFAKNIRTEDGCKKNWDNIKKQAEELVKVVIKEAKGIWKDVIDNWEAATILSLATIGLTFLIGELPNFTWVPAFIEAPMVIPVISVLIIMLLVVLLENKIKEDEHEVAGERVG